MKKQNSVPRDEAAQLKDINEQLRQGIMYDQEYLMKKLNSIDTPSPVPGDEATRLKAIYEQSREAIEFHSHPEKMTPAELFNIDDL